jgi:threonine/homoserine/homoserine lactone efflux protein
LFFLAFVPQVIEPTVPQQALAFLVRGAIFNCNGTLGRLLLAGLSARAGARGMSRRLGHGSFVPSALSASCPGCALRSANQADAALREHGP